MSASRKAHFFAPGRAGKGNKSHGEGPGVLIVEGRWRYRYNMVTKDGRWWKMNCQQQINPELSCNARAMVFKKDDGTFFLVKEEGDHNHDVNEAAIMAEEYKIKMVEIVKKDPSAPVGEAIKAVKREIAEEHSDNEQLLKDIVSELGSNHSLELKLLRVRNKIIGPLPKSRDRFDPRHFLKKIFKNKAENVEVLDSNKLPENWRTLVDKVNPDSQYRWDKKERNQKYEEEPKDPMESERESTPTESEVLVEDIGAETENIPNDGVPMDNVLGPEEENHKDSTAEPEEPPPAGKDLPKRILAFTTKRLLQLFAKSRRGSLDGTFKSCCKMWCQQFVWMVKYNGRFSHDISFFLSFS